MAINPNDYCSPQIETYNSIHRILTVETMLIPFLDVQLLSQQVELHRPEGTEKQDARAWLQSGKVVEFLRMGNFIRLGGELQIFLGHYHAFKKNLNWRADSQSKVRDAAQRVLPDKTGKKGQIIKIYQDELNIDLEKMPKFKSIQEYFVHRHLYTHQTGLVDKKYLDSLEAICGKQERDKLEQEVLATGKAKSIEDVVVYNFDPILHRYVNYLNDAIQFVLGFPK